MEPVLLSTAADPGVHRTERDGVRLWRVGLRNFYWPNMNARPHPALRTLWHVVDSYNLVMQRALRRVLEIERPDVVSIHNLSGWSAAAWGTIADADIPSVQVLHDSYAICPKATMYTISGNCAGQCVRCRMLRLPHRRLSNQVSAVVGVSGFILDRHLEQGYFGDVPVRRVIYNARDGAELGLGAASSRERSGRLRFGFIGRLDPTKGVEYLLETFAGAVLPDAELWIAGNGHEDYEQSLRSRYTCERVRFLGRVAPRDFYPEVDVVVVPSLWHEPLGMVVAEALSVGKPVIGSRRGGIPEIICDGGNGRLFEPGRPGELAAALQRLASNAPLRTQMSQATHASAKPFLDREGWVSRYVDVYSQIAGQASQAPRSSEPGKNLVNAARPTRADG
jgi:glycosyltransferase involved in cell wall biosynthesis